TVDSGHTYDSDRIFVSSRYDAGTGWMAGVRNHGGVDNQVIVDFGNSRAYTGISLAEDTPYFIAVIGDNSGTTVGGGTNKHRIAVYDVVAGTWAISDGTEFKPNLRLGEITIGAFTNDLNGREWEGLIDDVRI